MLSAMRTPLEANLLRRLMILLIASISTRSAVAQSPSPSFAVATVRAAPGADPNTGTWSPPGTGQFTATHIPLTILLQLAYGVDATQIANKPDWLGTALYDIRAKPEEGILLSRDELKPRLQNLLDERFHLVAHTEMRLSRVYALLVAEEGARLTRTKAEHFPGFRINVSSGQMRGENWSMPVLAKYLTSAAGFPVVDQTGLTGSYDISFSYAADHETEHGDTDQPSLSYALKKATGLVLKPQQVPVETVVIDSIRQTAAEN